MAKMAGFVLIVFIQAVFFVFFTATAGAWLIPADFQYIFFEWNQVPAIFNLSLLFLFLHLKSINQQFVIFQYPPQTVLGGHTTPHTRQDS
jgi:O-antigen/teichoic acid export membrane protein